MKQTGFRYVGRGLDGWNFERVRNGVTESMTIAITLGSTDELRMDITSSAYGRPWEWLDSEPLEDIVDVKATVKGLCDTFKTKGLQRFDIIDVPTSDIHPTPEMHRYMREHHREIYQKYRQSEFFHEEQSDALYGEIAAELKRMQGWPYNEETKKRLIELAVILGEYYIIKFGWKWRWQVKKKRIFLVSKWNAFCDNPLFTVVTAWGDQRFDILER